MQEANSFKMADILSYCSRCFLVFVLMIFVGTLGLPEINAHGATEAPCEGCEADIPIAPPVIPSDPINPDDPRDPSVPIDPDGPGVGDDGGEINPDDPIVIDPDGPGDGDIKPDPDDPGDPGDPDDPGDPGGPVDPGDPIDCDDGLFCTLDLNLGDSCSHTPRPVSEDGIPCTQQVCNEETDSIDTITDDSICDNGAFCDGEETCDAELGCQDGTSPVVDDGIDCTIEECDEENNVVIMAIDNASCDDGLFCNGFEECNPTLGCVKAGFGFPDDGIACTDRRCDEELDQFVFDPNDSKCDNGEFCDGVETCDPVNAEFGSGGCVADDDPPVGQECGDDSSSGVCNEELQCVETTGTITIVKVAIPPDGEDFRFFCVDENNEACVETDADGDGDSSFYLNDEDSDTDGIPNMMTFAGIPAGTYIFGEVLPPGWGIEDIICENEEGEQAGVFDDQAVIDLEPFEEITCTFFNELLCGNGKPDDGEECDPGIDPDFCSDECTLLDTDGDGVIDELDLCPETPADTTMVDEFGCPIEEMTCDCDDPNAITQGFSTRRGTYFFGTLGNDIICGTSERDIIFAFSGDDCIDSGPGNDIIFAGFGNDVADGGDDRDFVHGGFGIDICFGERLRRCE